MDDDKDLYSGINFFRNLFREPQNSWTPGGQLLHDVRQINVADVVFTYPLNHVEYVGAHVAVTLDEGEDGRQGLRTDHGPTRFQFRTILGGEFALELTGQSSARVLAIPNEPPVFRDGPGENTFTIYADADVADRLGGRPIRLEGFGSEDTVQIEGLSRSGVPQDTTFVFDGRRLLESEPSVFIELLVRNALFPLQIQVGNLPAGTAPPRTVLEGGAGTTDEARVFAAAGSGFDFIELLVRKIELLTMNGEEQVDLSTRPDGGLSVHSDGVRVTTDESMSRTSLAARRINVEYPEPEFRSLMIDTARMIELLVRPGGDFIIAILRDIDQHLTPNLGTINVGNWTLNHGDTPRDFGFDGSHIRSRMTGVFTRSITQRLRHTGSDSTIIVDNATMPGLDVTVEGAEGADNRIVMAMVDSTFTGPSSLTYQGPATGQNTIVVGRNGVTYNGDAATTEVHLAGTSDTVLFEASSNVNGTATTTAIEVNGGQAAVFSSALDSVVPIEQFGIIADLLGSPESQSDLERAEAAAWELAAEPLSRQVALRPPTSDPRQLVFTGAGAINVTALDETAAGMNITADTTGELHILREANVTVSVPALVGTGIDPQGPLHLCTVTNTSDSGPGSLREALECSYAAPANALAVVTYAIPGSDPNFVDIDSHLPGGDAEPDVFVISPLTALPKNFRGRVVINGQSQQNLTGDSNSSGPEIVLSGQLAGVGVDGLVLQSLQNRIHAFNIQSFEGDGIEVGGYGNVVTASFIGTDATGTVMSPNGASGVRIVQGRDNVIGGTTAADRNVISGNAEHGILIVGNSFPAVAPIFTDNPDQLIRRGNIVHGNFIGTTADGMGRLGNTRSGIYVDNSGLNILGGINVGAGNVISANSTGVAIAGERAFENRVAGNFIGTAADGTGDLGNTHGVAIVGDLGLSLGASGNRIGGASLAERNVISGNDLNDVFLARTLGVFLARTLGNIVEGNFIGTDVSGTSMVATDPRGAVGVRLEDDKDSLIHGNLISGQAYGIYFGGRWVAGGTERTRVEGNLIGTMADGKHALPGFANYWGISIDGYVDSDGVTHEIRDVTIGGTEQGAGNVISGSANHGIWINGPGVEGIQIQGNRIGTDADGVHAIPNGTASATNGAGILLTDTSGVLIGGIEDGAGNIISGNNGSGISILRGSGHWIEGNFIGTDVSGTRDLGNSGDGVRVDTSSGNTIGGAVTAARNIISGNNSDGVELRGIGASGNMVLGNFIGTDVTGTTALRNNGNGVTIREGARNNRIGDGRPGAGNVISGNAGSGVAMYSSGTTGNSVQGNFIGTDAEGKAALGNFIGVEVNTGASANVIGTNGDGIDDGTEGNVISGHGYGGVLLWHGGVSGHNVVAGNRIGTDVTGRAALGNNIGVWVLNSAHNRVGTNADGVSDDLERNIISGNAQGVAVQVSSGIYNGADWNVIAGNYIGTDETGTMPLGNWQTGIVLGFFAGNTTGESGPRGTRIGGTSPAERNVISAGVDGIGLDQAIDTVIEGNYIGTDVTGMLAMGNAHGYGSGVLVSNSVNTQIGGIVAGSRNVISANSNGISIINGSLGTRVQGNYIGTDVTGNAALGNLYTGISIYSGASHSLIGGTTENAGNVISGNGLSKSYYGVFLVDAPDNVLQGNYIGVNAAGNAALGNSGPGLAIFRSPNTLVGGSEPGAGNVISANHAVGVQISDSGSSGTRMHGNYIGTDPSGTAPLGNHGH